MCCHPMPHIWELLQGGILAYEGLQGNVLVIGVKVHWNAAGLRPLSLKVIVSQKKERYWAFVLPFILNCFFSWVKW